MMRCHRFIVLHETLQCCTQHQKTWLTVNYCSFNFSKYSWFLTVLSNYSDQHFPVMYLALETHNDDCYTNNFWKLNVSVRNEICRSQFSCRITVMHLNLNSFLSCSHIHCEDKQTKIETVKLKTFNFPTFYNISPNGSQ